MAFEMFNDLYAHNQIEGLALVGQRPGCVRRSAFDSPEFKKVGIQIAGRDLIACLKQLQRKRALPGADIQDPYTL